MLSTTILKSVGGVSPPCVVLRFALNWGTWYPFLRVTTYCHAQKSTRMLHIFSSAPYPSKVFNSSPRSRLSYDSISYKNTNIRRFCSKLSSSCASFSSIVAVPVPFPMRNPWRMSCNIMVFLIYVSIMVSITFYRTSRSPIPWVSVLPLWMRIKIFHTRYVGIVPCSHMNCTSSKSFIHFAGLGEGVVSSAGYASLIHVLK